MKALLWIALGCAVVLATITLESLLPRPPWQKTQAAIQPDVAAESLTHSVWRAENGKIEDECPSVGFPTMRGRGAIVLCVVNAEQVPLYVEADITVYPFPVIVNRDNGTVRINGRATITVRD